MEELELPLAPVLVVERPVLPPPLVPVAPDELAETPVLAEEPPVPVPVVGGPLLAPSEAPVLAPPVAPEPLMPFVPPRPVLVVAPPLPFEPADVADEVPVVT